MSVQITDSGFSISLPNFVANKDTCSLKISSFFLSFGGEVLKKYTEKRLSQFKVTCYKLQG